MAVKRIGLNNTKDKINRLLEEEMLRIAEANLIKNGKLEYKNGRLEIVKNIST